MPKACQVGSQHYETPCVHDEPFTKQQLAAPRVHVSTFCIAVPLAMGSTLHARSWEPMVAPRLRVGDPLRLAAAHSALGPDATDTLVIARPTINK